MSSTYSTVWEPKVWNGLSDISGHYVWNDGDNIYYSEQGYEGNPSHYVLNKATSTWTPKTWNGTTAFDGCDIWTDGANYYSSNGENHYVLNKTTSTWSEKTWNGLTNFNGVNIWTDGENIYYSSYSSGNYVLNKATSTWESKTWNGISEQFDGKSVWHYHGVIYLTDSSTTYMLDVATSTWSEKSWNGSHKPYQAAYMWTDGDKYYLSESGYAQWVLDEATSTWEDIIWEGYNYVDGRRIWTDGDEIYCSDYKLQKNAPSTNYLSKIVLPISVSGEVQNVEYALKDAEARELIEDIGHALYWIGVTTTEIGDGDTTNPITVDSESVTANLGGMASYGGVEFVWNGSAWQELGKNNFGALAFKSSASGSYTPTGSISITQGTDTTATITGLASVGSLPSAYFTASNETVTFNWSAGSLPTTDESATTAITARGADTASFTGTAATITVE